MSSAIELYKEAYDLDFNKGDSLYAEVLYKELIERYPHSDEREYAEIHLERIAKLKGNPNDPTFKPLRSGGGGGGLAVVSFVLTLFLFVAVGFGFYYGYQQYRRISSYEQIIHGLLSEKHGDFTDAQYNFESAQQISPNNGVAYRCLAELYLQEGKLQQAELVSKQWELLLPSDLALPTFKQRIQDSTSQVQQP